MRGTPLHTPAPRSVVARIASVPGAALLIAGYMISRVRGQSIHS